MRREKYWHQLWLKKMIKLNSRRHTAWSRAGAKHTGKSIAMRLWPWKHVPKPVQDNQDYEQYTAYSQLLDRNGQWIGVADTKAGVILGFLVAAFPVLAAPALPVVQKVVKAISRNANFWAYLLA